MPVPPPSMAMPARSAASCIAWRAARSAPSSTALGKWSSTRRMACSAGAATSELHRRPVTASTAWTKASSPVAAVTWGGIVDVADRVEYDEAGDQLVTPRPDLAPGGGRQDARARDLGARAGSRRDGHHRRADGERMGAEGVVLDPVASAGDGGGLLGRVEGRAAADADDDCRAGVTHQRGRVIDGSRRRLVARDDVDLDDPTAGSQGIRRPPADRRVGQRGVDDDDRRAAIDAVQIGDVVDAAGPDDDPRGARPGNVHRPLTVPPDREPPPTLRSDGVGGVGGIMVRGGRGRPYWTRRGRNPWIGSVSIGLVVRLGPSTSISSSRTRRARSAGGASSAGARSSGCRCR